FPPRRSVLPVLPEELRFEGKAPVRVQTSGNRCSKDKQLLIILVQVPVSLTVRVVCHQRLRGGAFGGAATGRSWPHRTVPAARAARCRRHGAGVPGPVTGRMAGGGQSHRGGYGRRSRVQGPVRPGGRRGA